MAQKSTLVQGTLDMLILRVLSRGDLHGWGITEKLEQLSKNALRVEEGSLYPSLYRMAAKGWIKGEWKLTEKGQRAKFYALTRAGQKQLATEKKSWDRVTSIISQVMESS
jgi:PadR family transcriptional regulator PadR